MLHRLWLLWLDCDSDIFADMWAYGQTMINHENQNPSKSTMFSYLYESNYLLLLDSWVPGEFSLCQSLPRLSRRGWLRGLGSHNFIAVVTAETMSGEQSNGFQGSGGLTACCLDDIGMVQIDQYPWNGVKPTARWITISIYYLPKRHH